MSIPLNIDWQQILLHLFNFAILGGGLYLLLYKPVKDFMDKRVQYYSEMEQKANETLSEAEKLKGDYAAQIEKADDEIAEKKAKAAKDAEALAEEKIKEASEQAVKIIADAEENAALEKQKMITSARQEIVELAAAATKKLVKESLDKAKESGANE
ncbi:MAG: ATP synthase F0 subunit B [Clostridia bacterium]|nr:ATP synthase F0 subunit B [Clostridia bacterium]